MITPKFKLNYIMSSLIVGSIRVDKLPKEKFIQGKDGAVYANITISVGDETRYGNNVSIYDSQTKEEREAKVQRNYLGNAKVVWTDNKITLAEREDNEQKITVPVDEQSGDLPF